jgi:hypothetical protein
MLLVVRNQQIGDLDPSWQRRCSPRGYTVSLTNSAVIAREGHSDSRSRQGWVWEGIAPVLASLCDEQL